MLPKTPLTGLVLSGGKSARMGTPKEKLVYGGKPQLAAAVELLTPFCEAVFVSNRAEQAEDPLHKDFAQIHDRFPEGGPLAGMVSAMEAHPAKPFLVLACDIPGADAELISFLVHRRNPACPATVFEVDGHIEPLCAIYEGSLQSAFKKAYLQGQRSPKKLLEDLPVCRLTPPDAHKLYNVNTPEESEKYKDSEGKDPTQP